MMYLERTGRRTLVCAAIVVAVGASAKERSGPEAFDLVCAIASAAQATQTVNGSEAWNIALNTHWFYLGRLSGRDDTTNWFMVVTGRLAELKDKAKMPEMYGDCLKFASSKIQ